MVKKRRKQKQKKKNASRKGQNAFQISRNRKQSLAKPEVNHFIETVQTRQSIWHTMTGEIMMMARLHFSGIDKEKITAMFSQLKCMAFDDKRNRWLWLYRNESRHFCFKLPYDAVPKENHPIVLGVFTPWGEEGDTKNNGNERLSENGASEIRLCVSSFDRAAKAVDFFDRIVPEGIGKCAHLTLMNRVFEVIPGGAPPLPDSESYFKNVAMESGVRDRFNRELGALRQTLVESSPECQVDLLEQFWRNGVPYLIPDFEVLPLNGYNGLDALKRGLSFREKMALMKHDAEDASK